MTSLPDNIVELFLLASGQLARAMRDARIDLPMTLIRVVKALEDGARSPQALAHALHKDKGQLTRMLRECSNRGLTISATNPGDRRSKVINLTDHGRAILTQVKKAEASVATQLTQGVTERNMQTFRRVLRTMITNAEQGTSRAFECCE